MSSTTVTIGVAAETSLEDLNTIVAQKEDAMGPLTAMGNDKSQTLLTFDTALDPPANHAVIAPDKEGNPVIPSGAGQICKGVVFVKSVKTASTASRKRQAT